MNKKELVRSKNVSFFSHKIKRFNIPAVISIFFVGIMLSTPASAHRGAGNEVDTCRFSVGSEVIHFSAYTPTETGGKDYCHVIPNVAPTHLVFDYEGKKLRNTTVEFEITKEPDGTRIYYQAPEKIKKGSVDAKIDFTQFGAGTYLAHVTIMYKGEKLDSHLPFAVGMDPDAGSPPYKIIVPVILILISWLVISMRVKRKDEADAHIKENDDES